MFNGYSKRLMSVFCLQKLPLAHFVLRFVPRAAARLLPVPVPIQVLRWGANLLEATYSGVSA